MSSERRKPYPFDEIEPKWQAIWEERQLFHAPNPGEKGFDPAKPKFYVLDMFPYPSGAGLHVGHPEGYTATDIVARHKRMLGFNVLHPMGWDAFGLPAEQYAIKSGQHPAVTTRENVAKFKSQLKRIGFSYDWQRELNTTDPRYYKWTQWIFLQIYNSWFDPEKNKARPISELIEKFNDDKTEPDSAWRTAHESRRRARLDSYRLAYVVNAPVWWCPELGTVLANEEVVDGKSEIGGFRVERRPMRQWMLRITAYAQRLIDELERLDWPEGIKLLQRNWIGRSEGAEVHFPIANSAEEITVFTTRPDTLFGATYMVLAPENEVIDALIPSTWPQETPAEWKFACPNPRAAIETFRDFVRSLSDLQRQLGKSGVFSGVFAINPVNHEEIPIFFSEYVLGHYGTGAIMGVPAHDQRDLEFAHRYGLLIKPVIEPPIAWLREHYNPLSPLGISPGQFLRAIYGTPTPTLEQIERASETSTPPSPELEHIAERLSQLSGEGKEFCEMCIGILIYVTAVPDPPAEMLDLLRFCYLTDPQFFTKGFSPEAYIDEGRMINSTSDFLSVDGLSCTEAKKKIAIWLEQHGCGKGATNYKLRDWLFSRQRYWGEPFPIVWENGKHRALDEKELPVVPPPLDDYKPTGTGEPPLAKAKDWIRYSEKALRETNVMPQWAGSCWYYLRFCDPHNDKRFAGEEAERYWMGGPKPGGVDLYVGGTEHAVLHLLYARFWHKVLFDLGYLSKPEPFQRLVNQGIILGETEYFGFVFGSGSVEGFVSAEGVEQITDVALVVKDNISAEDVADMKEATSHLTGIHKPTGRPVFGLRINEGEKHVDKRGEHFYLSGTTIRLEVRTAKMSKSRGNVINPDDVIDQYGADAFRCYEMFMGPLEQMKPWSMRGVEGVARFLARVWRLFMTESQAGEWELSARVKNTDSDKAQQKLLHATIKKVTEDIESFSFNTAISQMMIFVNAFTSVDVIPLSAMRSFLILLNPFAPHVASELWERLNAKFTDAHGDLTEQPWPSYDEQLLAEKEVEIVIQINGKLRDRMKMSALATEEELKTAALSNQKIQDRLAGKAVRNIIVVPRKLVNIVV